MLSILFLSVFSYSECVEILKGISHTVQHEITPMVDALLGHDASLDGGTYVSPFLSPGVPQVKVEPFTDIFGSLNSISADIASIKQSVEAISDRIARNAKAFPYRVSAANAHADSIISQHKKRQDLGASEIDARFRIMVEERTFRKLIAAKAETRYLKAVLTIQKFIRKRLGEISLVEALAAYERKRFILTKDPTIIFRDEAKKARWFEMGKKVKEAQESLLSRKRAIKNKIKKSLVYGNNSPLGDLIDEYNDWCLKEYKLREDYGKDCRDLETVSKPNFHFVFVDGILRRYVQEIIRENEPKDEATEENLRRKIIVTASQDRPDDYTTLYKLAKEIVKNVQDSDIRLHLLNILFHPNNAKRLFDRCSAENFLESIGPLRKDSLIAIKNGKMTLEISSALFYFLLTGRREEINYSLVGGCSHFSDDYCAFLRLWDVNILVELKRHFIKALMFIGRVLELEAEAEYLINKFRINKNTLYREYHKCGKEILEILEYRPLEGRGLAGVLYDPGVKAPKDPRDELYNEVLKEIRDAIHSGHLLGIRGKSSMDSGCPECEEIISKVK